jgi:Na+-transporting methylmalonyl-CoA/oxaloacetate decarboxylase gamma subunit
VQQYAKRISIKTINGVKMFWDTILEGLLVLIVGITGVLLVLFIFYLIIEGVNKLELFLVETQKKKQK